MTRVGFPCLCLVMISLDRGWIIDYTGIVRETAVRYRDETDRLLYVGAIGLKPKVGL